ncbi:MAG: hypothetical protein BWY22_01493 [Bacteroidetes bacterium ADurb.Bin217]|nr:MAG: hypothetical protein BWY22_01493 [Bacteroidetes bacterium ADurb.Bin217]
MARLLSQRLIERLKNGDFKNILLSINQDSELSLEIRLSSIAMIYYKKSKILTLHSRKQEPTILADGYCTLHSKPILNLDNPSEYFKNAKKIVDEHVKKKKNIEFAIQQKISADNNSNMNHYLVVDMEYQFAQQLIKERTTKKTRFDLVAIDLQNNKIILFELKQGFASSTGTSGVHDHIIKYQEHFNHSVFRSALISDIKSIIEQKEELGIYQFPTNFILENLANASIVFKVIFAFNNSKEKDIYKNKYGNNNETLFIDISDSKYIIKNDNI